MRRKAILREFSTYDFCNRGTHAVRNGNFRDFDAACQIRSECCQSRILPAPSVLSLDLGKEVYEFVFEDARHFEAIRNTLG